MAVSNAYTLTHLAKISENPLEKGIITNLLRYTEVFNDIPFRNVESLKTVAVRWAVLPSPAFRKINTGYTPSLGDTEQVWETVYPVGGELRFDRIFDKIGNTIADPQTQQVDMHMKALALTLNNFFISGDHAVNGDSFEGLQKRVDGMPARQSVYFGASGAAALDPTASNANATSFLDKWDEMWYKCNAGNVSAIFANEGMKWGLIRVLRFLQLAGDFLDTSKDQFGRTVLEFRGVPVKDVGLQVDQATDIIPDNQIAGDAGTDATSVYFVSHDMQEGLVGIQLSPLEIYDPLNKGEMEATPTELIRYEWVVGLAGFGSRGIVRGRNVEGASNWT